MAKSGFAKEHLRSFIERIERLEEEKLRSPPISAKSIPKPRARASTPRSCARWCACGNSTSADRQEQEAMLDLYLSALGMRQLISPQRRVPRRPVRLSPAHPRLQAEFLELAVERRAADAEAARHFRHVAVIARDRHADDFGFQVFELAHMAGRVGGRTAHRANAAPADAARRTASCAPARAHARHRRCGALASTPIAAAICGKVADIQHGAVAQHDGAEDRVLQLAHIARPVEALDQVGWLPASGRRPACSLRRRSAR